MSTSSLFAISLILCFVVNRTSGDISLVKTLQGQEQFNNTRIYFDHESETNGTLFYLLCHRTEQNNVPCTIFKEEHYVDKLPRICLCNVTLKAEDPYVRVGEEVRVWPFNPNKALILWVGIGRYGSGPLGLGENSSLRNTIVDFETCITNVTIMTTSTEYSLNPKDILDYPVTDFLVKSAGFVCYDNICNISFHDRQCGIDFCKLSIDKNTGMVSSGIDFWYKQKSEIADIVVKDTKNPNGGHFIIDKKDGVIYTFDKDQGLSCFPSATYNESWQNFKYSVQDHFITVCKEIEETKVKCDQIEYNGRITMHVKFDLKKRNVAPVPYTLRGGGFLLLTTECESNCTEKATNHVYNVDTEGKLSKLIDIESFNCKVNKFTHWYTFFKNEQENLCVSMLCYESKNSGIVYAKTWIPNIYMQTVYFNTPEELHVQCLNIFDSDYLMLE